MIIDRSILRCCRNVDLSVHSGYPTESTGHFQLLPCQYLSGYDQPQYLQHFDFPSSFPTPVLSTKPRSLGERTLVHELGN